MYTKYYGLTSKPFENTPDPLFLFMSNKHREVLASLTYGINSAKGFILIAGDIGTGKTTLIHVLLKEINPDFVIINIINPRAAFNDMLYHLAKKIGVSYEGKDKIDLVEDIRNKLEKLDQDGRRAVLIIDEAHLIPDESLEDIRLLSNIESEKRKLIQIVLVGQNELYNKLQKEALRPLKQRIVINRHLEPLDKKETRDYIKHRLNVAGRRSQLFDQKALSKIWGKSRGIPRVINQICDNAMLIGYALEADTIGRKIIKEVIKDMESGHRHKKPEIKIYISRFKWLGATVSAALLVILLTRYAGNKACYQQELEPVKKSFSSIKNNSTMPLQSVLNNNKVPKPSEIELKQDIPEPIPIKPAEVTILKEIKEPETKKNQTPIQENEQATEATGLSTTEKSDKVLTNNDIVEISEERTNLNRQLLSKPINEIDAERDDPEDNRKKVQANEWLLKIARIEYGVTNNTIIDLIHMANPGIKNVDCIYAGRQIILPHIEKKDLIAKDENGNFHIHYASFYNFGQAQQSVQELINDKKEAFIIPSKQGDNLVYRVYIGIFKSQDDAESSLNDLKLKHLSFLDKK